MEFDLSHQFVDERVSRQKYDSQVDQFQSRKDEFRKKGIIPLLIDFPVFEFAFIAQESIFSFQNSLMLGVSTNNVANPQIQLNAPGIKIPYPSFLFSVRIDYSNYDIVAPSLRFVNPITSVEMQHVSSSIIIRPDQQDHGSIVNDSFKTHVQNIVLRDIEGRLFVCLRGLREYHMHLQHDGDAWGLYRGSQLGRVSDILDKLYLYSIHNMKSITSTS